MKAPKSTNVRVKISSLFVAEENVRQNEEGIPALADMIHAQGLIQNLTGFKEKKSGRSTGRHGVCAGGRRTRALQLLVEDGRLSGDDEVDMKLVPQALARIYSLMENQHVKMHPAEEFLAFKVMAEEGQTVEEIAATFGVTPGVITRRLKLGNLAPEFLDMYKKGEAKIEELRVLCLTDDHDLQRKAWAASPNWNREHNLKEFLTQGEVSSTSKLAVFVGVEAYEAAGGTVRRDLFSTNDLCYLNDPALLSTLATEKLAKIAAELAESEKLAWVESHMSIDYHQLVTYKRARVVANEQSDEVKAESADLDAKIEAIYERMEQLSADEETYDEQHDALQVEVDALNEKLEKLETNSTIIHPEDAPLCGAVVTLNWQGALEIHRDRLQPVVATDEDGEGDGATGTASGVEPAKAKPVHSAALVKELTAHRTAAMQAVLTTRPEVALVVLAHRLAKSVFTFYSEESAAEITVTRPGLDSVSDAVANSPALAKMAQAKTEWEARFPKKGEGSVFAWLLDQPQTVVMDLLAFCTACGLNTVQESERQNDAANRLSKAIDLDMSDWWEATPEAYFGRVSKAHTVSVVASAVSPEVAAPLSNLKKGEAAAAAAQNLTGKRWLPELLKSA